MDSPDRVATLADEMEALVERFSLAHGHTASQWFSGWSVARKGRPHDGHRLIREAYEHNTRLGMRAGASEVLGYAAEALLLAGDVEGAQAQLREALEIADALSEGVYRPQLLLLQAAIARAQGESEASAASVRSAVEVARVQEAPWLELLALVDLCASHDAVPAERRALAKLVEELPEAAGTEPVKRARSLQQAAKRA